MENELQLLIEKYFNNTCSKEELARLFAITAGDSTGLLEVLRNRWLQIELDGTESRDRQDQLFHAMMAGLKDQDQVSDQDLAGGSEAPVHPIGRHRSIFRVAVGAAAILIAGGMLWLAGNKNHRETRVIPQRQAVARVVVPGGQKAILALSDGRHIDLGVAANGAIARQGGSNVMKTGGKIDYSEGGTTSVVMYNTISTPRGGEYQLQLADGTRVWLNAASSLRFPTAFTGKDRTVELTGEAYFEVRPNAAMPFHVKVKNADIEDLATEFDINAYDDEVALRTTLVKGGVRVSGQAHTIVLKPNEQAVMDDKGLAVNADVDIDAVTAWKEGNFVFNSTNLEEIMKQIARWYDLQVQFDFPYQTRTFSGIVSRNSPLSQVLDIMKQAGIKFQLEGGMILVGQ